MKTETKMKTMSRTKYILIVFYHCGYVVISENRNENENNF